MSEFRNIPKIINGDVVVGMTNSKKIKDLGWADNSSIYSWYEDDPNKNHLGLVELFSNMADYRLPTYRNFFKEGAVIEVNGMNGKFTYDLEVTKSSGVYTVDDTSTYSDTPGLDGTVFPIRLDQPYTIGDVLTYDAMYGQNVVVSEDYEVEQIGDMWEHWVTMVTYNPQDYYPKEKLKAGVQYFKIGHSLGEFSEKFSSIQNPVPVGTIKCEFELGNHRGVETFYTMYADKKSMSGAAIRSQDFMDKFVREMEKIGTDEFGHSLDTFYVGKLNANGKINPRTVRIGATLEYLVLLELMKLESYQLLFQRGGMVNDINGTKRLNEGIWHQIRRGHKIQYNTPGGLKRSHIQEAVNYLFPAGTNTLPHERRVKLKGGYMAYLNVLNIFREEVMMQLDGLAQLLGHSSALPKSPVSGSSLTSLKMEPVMFQEVNIPGIGIIQIEHDPSLDYQPLTNQADRGMFGEGYAWTSYSLVIWDARSEEYSNAFSSLPNNAKIQNPKTKSNIFYVKPEGQNMYWGYSNGRYAPDKASDIHSSLKVMGREFWSHSASASHVLDKSIYVFIELKR